MAVLLTGGVGESAPKRKAPTVGVSLLTKQHIFYKDLEAGMRSTARRLNIRLLVQSAEFDLAAQTAQVEDFITQKVDAIVVCPVDSAGIGGAIKHANRAGIPVFTADIAAKEGKVASHIASDNIQGGRLAGQYMVKALRGQGKIAIIDHPIVTSVQDRVRGFLEALKSYKGIKVVARQTAEGQRDKAMSVMENLLQAHPDLKGVFGINDDSALGALAAIKAAGRNDIVVIGYDATPEARKAILSGGPLKADSVQHPDRIGKITIETVTRYLAGQKVPPYIPVAVGIVDRVSLMKR